MRLQGLEIPVVDMDRAFAFYTKVLGFPVINRRGSFLTPPDVAG